MRFIRTISKRLTLHGAGIVLCFAAGMLAGCGQQRVEVEKPVPYAVAVATGCIDPRARPAVPDALKKRYTPEQWAALSPGAKAFAVEAQAGRRLSYEELDRAATAGCKVATPQVSQPASK
jgi:hypothetical protein